MQSKDNQVPKEDLQPILCIRCQGAYSALPWTVKSYGNVPTYNSIINVAPLQPHRVPVLSHVLIIYVNLFAACVPTLADGLADNPFYNTTGLQ